MSPLSRKDVTFAELTAGEKRAAMSYAADGIDVFASTYKVINSRRQGIVSLHRAVLVDVPAELVADFGTETDPLAILMGE